ncbi:polymerase delta-interacting protein 3 isoform X1 [Ambystoma mexicanum]|uniref:polymerase delta-interacting protein 3 isoform X1 n=1 Tax=Ambystoma mexicanum TaxID=8296 RepID=UPI0037E77BE8
MADLSLDDLIRKRGLAAGGRPNTRPVAGGVRSRIGVPQRFGVPPRIGIPQPGFNRPVASATSFQRTFDARQKIGITDARQRLGLKDAREKLVQKDARFRIQGKVQDAREMLNSRKQHGDAGEAAGKMLDAREKIGFKRSAPAAIISPAISSGPSAMKITKTIQIPQHKPVSMGLMHGPAGMRINVVNHQPPSQRGMSQAGSYIPMQGLEDMEDEEFEEDDEELTTPVPRKQLKVSPTNSFLQKRPGLSGPQFSLSKTVPLTKVVQNDSYTAPAPQILPPAPLRSKHLTNMSRTLVTREEPPAPPLPPVEPVYSPLEGTKMTVNNLHPRVTEEDIVELFCVCGALKRARLVNPGIAEVVFVKKDDAVSAYKKYNNRCLDGQPMKCNLHMNGNVITSDQPILLRLSDTPSAAKKETDTRRAAPVPSKPAPEVDPDTILKALFKSSAAATTSASSTAFKIKL